LQGQTQEKIFGAKSRKKFRGQPKEKFPAGVNPDFFYRGQPNSKFSPGVNPEKNFRGQPKKKFSATAGKKFQIVIHGKYRLNWAARG
jgi:hypothetical protein